ncbi:hypothetical protein B0H66DRAFT_607285 [Apodospora peruviana]|uniref:Uncharacterized protein n=1 Tax=Apodospora peruviana TaxID=516989 RepID=A0AAE0HXY1_9PEZI|nr:hypothetical protein B0H66DRAFT_607285 [Apodospora peruviana]
MIATGSYLADHVHGFYTSFEKFDTHGSIPYYSLMYYEGVAQAAYGRIEAVASETAAPNTNEKEFSRA